MKKHPNRNVGLTKRVVYCINTNSALMIRRPVQMKTKTVAKGGSQFKLNSRSRERVNKNVKNRIKSNKQFLCQLRRMFVYLQYFSVKLCLNCSIWVHYLANLFLTTFFKFFSKVQILIIFTCSLYQYLYFYLTRYSLI